MSENMKQSGGAAAKKSASLLPAQEIAKEIKPLSQNGFLAFWQGLWRKWLGVWYGFSDRHPTASKWIYKLAFFFIFSNGVTIWQALVMIFLPYAFQGMWDVPFVWPAAALPWMDAAGTALNYAIFNEPVKFLNAANEVLLASTAATVTEYTAAGHTLQMSGLGNFLAFEIAVFTAQCINLPLQRNITFKSKGNWVYQAMWYFIGWVGISIGVNALWGIMNPLMLWWNWNDVGIAILKTVITGGISMAVFFPIFVIIFPDAQKVAKKKQAKLEKLLASGATGEVVTKAKFEATKAQEAADFDKAQKDASKAKSVSNARAVSYQAIVRNSEKAGENLKELEAANADAEKIAKAKETVAAYETKVPESQQKASDAVAARIEAEENFKSVSERVLAARAARGEDAKGKKIAA